MDSQFFLFVLREMFYNLFNEQLGDKLKFVLSPDVILCGWLGSKHQLNLLTCVCESHLNGYSFFMCKSFSRGKLGVGVYGAENQWSPFPGFTQPDVYMCLVLIRKRAEDTCLMEGCRKWQKLQIFHSLTSQSLLSYYCNNKKHKWMTELLELELCTHR